MSWVVAVAVNVTWAVVVAVVAMSVRTPVVVIGTGKERSPNDRAGDA